MTQHIKSTSYNSKHITFLRRTASQDSLVTLSDNKEYTSHVEIGKGAFGMARSFINLSNSKDRIAVLKPSTIVEKNDFGEKELIEEALRKKLFFEKIYPHLIDKIKITFFEDDRNIDYRLLLPHFEGDDFNAALKVKKASNKLKVILSLAKALKDAKDKGVCILDLKSNNIKYNHDTNSTFLIDGGLFEFEGEEISSRCKNIVEVYQQRRKYPHCAPEYFQTKDSIATHAMDVYSFAMMIDNAKNKGLLNELNTNLIPHTLVNKCLSKKAKRRPAIESVIDNLEKNSLLQDHEVAIKTPLCKTIASLSLAVFGAALIVGGIIAIISSLGIATPLSVLVIMIGKSTLLGCGIGAIGIGTATSTASASSLSLLWSSRSKITGSIQQKANKIPFPQRPLTAMHNQC